MEARGGEEALRAFSFLNPPQRGFFRLRFGGMLYH